MTQRSRGACPSCQRPLTLETRVQAPGTSRDEDAAWLPVPPRSRAECDGRCPTKVSR